MIGADGDDARILVLRLGLFDSSGAGVYFAVVTSSSSVLRLRCARSVRCGSRERSVVEECSRPAPKIGGPTVLLAGSSVRHRAGRRSRGLRRLSRRHVSALVVVLALGFIGGVIGGVLQAIAFETALVVSVGSSALGGLIGVLIAWRQRNPLQQPQSQSKPQRQSSRRPHYGVSRG